MKKAAFFLLALGFLSTIGLKAQTTEHNYTYDANGNRILRHSVTLKVANPNTPTTLPNGLTEQQVLAGTTLQEEGFALKAYPNPAQEAVHVDLANATAVTVAEARLYTGSGAVATTLSQPGNTFAVPLEGLAAGNYILWLKLSNGEIKRVQVVKM